MVNGKQITAFLLKALKASWANEKVEETNPFPKLKLIKFEDGDWRYVDQYVGGEPFQGFEVVWFKDVPVWSMTYRGVYAERPVRSANLRTAAVRSYSGKEDYKQFLKFLKAALMQMPADAPFRGPKEYTSGNWKYKNHWSGKVKEFKGKEVIYFNNKQVYWAEYQGGSVNNGFANL